MRNSPVDLFDPLGLASASTACTAADEKRIRDSLKGACKKFEDPKKCNLDCLRNNLPPDPAGGDPAGLALHKIRDFCKKEVDSDKVNVRCDYNNSTDGCKKHDTAYGDHDKTITFCAGYLNGNLAKNQGYTDDCAAIHEIAHWGFGDATKNELDGASTYDKCFGCPGTPH